MYSCLTVLGLAFYANDISEFDLSCGASLALRLWDDLFQAWGLVCFFQNAAHLVEPAQEW